MTTKRSQSPDAAFLCQHTFADERRCRMLRNEHSYLCPFHARQREQRRQAKELQDEILSLQYRLTTAADIHNVLGKVFDALAQNQITTRMAGKLRLPLPSPPPIPLSDSAPTSPLAHARAFLLSAPNMTEGTPTPPHSFVELRILKDFKSSKMDLRETNGLRSYLAELRIPKEITKSFSRARVLPYSLFG